ncbi:hypothetical protein FH609_002455 [Streptomyces sp. 3MP-14]|uniref:Uncharacterized protein n=1 Tax=Streptomyces mimosae TaxID=2586635 RepID=A0A5N6AS96_9ACTN|nr:MULTISPECIES: hypothetical protein [Streptomyces]KAB8170790.1 hypothetical protein FH607_000015 [Streptomyces mimosae]KAB8179857.1 hypothetical protein FH609_002455 [Streptomyces sp. 3MP-14]
MRIDDVVEVPTPSLLAPGLGELARVAGLPRVVPEDRNGPGGVGGAVTLAPTGKPVQAEVVPHAVRIGHLPVLAVVVAVLRAGEQLDTGAVVVLLPPDARGVVSDQLTGRTVEHERGVVTLPAQVTHRVGRVDGAAALVLLAGDVTALDESRRQRPAVSYPVGLVVGGGGAAVHVLGGVGE